MVVLPDVNAIGFSGTVVLHQVMSGGQASAIAFNHLENVQIYCGKNYAQYGFWLENSTGVTIAPGA